ADENGVGNGGTPLGIVISNGEFKYGENAAATNIVGFDNNNLLHVGTMTPQKLKELNIRDAVSFGPAIVINSKPIKTSGIAGGLNPRTAIGQRADGAVLLLVIDGRQPHSLGANLKDLADIMIEHGAINAGNLDGGSSTMMYYEGKLANTCASLYGPRKIPNGFLVR
ncbi:MAG: phosphodiester glycosidase family protein, partial [Oscillospiraceae bacterium]